MARADLYLSTDVEADGPLPGPYSMSSLGIAVAGRYDGTTFERFDPERDTFYAELKPISTDVDPQAAAVSGLDRDSLVRDGEDPRTAMQRCVRWGEEVSARHDARPVFVAYPLGFDWMFVYWYLLRFTGGSPFGHSAHLDLKTFYAARSGATVTRSTKRSMPVGLLSRRPHTHNALDDAVEQADLLANLMAFRAPARTPSG